MTFVKLNCKSKLRLAVTMKKKLTYKRDRKKEEIKKIMRNEKKKKQLKPDPVSKQVYMCVHSSFPFLNSWIIHSDKSGC